MRVRVYLIRRNRFRGRAVVRGFDRRRQSPQRGPSCSRPCASTAWDRESGATICGLSKPRKKATAGSSRRENAADDPRFAPVVAAVAGKRDVTRESRQGFGSGALKVNGRIFAMMTPRAEFVVKIPKARVDQLVNQGVGERFEPGPGRVMTEWLALDGHTEVWIELAKEAYEFVKKQR